MTRSCADFCMLGHSNTRGTHLLNLIRWEGTQPYFNNCYTSTVLSAVEICVPPLDKIRSSDAVFVSRFLTTLPLWARLDPSAKLILKLLSDRYLHQKKVQWSEQRTPHQAQSQDPHCAQTQRSHQIIYSSASSLMKAVYMLHPSSAPCNIPQAKPARSVK